jgi:DNA/RNA endonuclease G (NUC1)
MAIQYPSGILTDSLYTKGDKFVLNGKPYVGAYHQIADKFYTGKTPTDTSKQLIPLLEFLKQKALSKLPFDPNKMYFSKKVNEKNVKKIGVNEYNKRKGDPLYVSIEVDMADLASIQNATQLFPDITSLINGV